MIIAPSAQRQIDSYLDELGVHLHMAPAEEAREFIEEIRSHILETASDDRLVAATVPDVLAELGPASTLAANYLQQNIVLPVALPMVRRAERRRAFAGRASVLARTMRTFLAVIVACGVAGVSIVGVVSKISHPQRAGLWRFGADEFSLHLGLRPGFMPPPVGQELLGWYIVPLGLLIGGVALLAANQIVRGWLRQLRLSQHTGFRLVSS